MGGGVGVVGESIHYVSLALFVVYSQSIAVFESTKDQRTVMMGSMRRYFVQTGPSAGCLVIGFERPVNHRGSPQDDSSVGTLCIKVSLTNHVSFSKSRRR